jgi:hypothetical protein
VNTGDLAPGLQSAERRVREIQAKLHRWAGDDLYSLVFDPAFVLVAWDRVRADKGARSAGVDGKTAYAIEAELGVGVFCDRLREQLKARSFRPVPVRERMIPNAIGKNRRQRPQTDQPAPRPDANTRAAEAALCGCPVLDHDRQRRGPELGARGGHEEEQGGMMTARVACRLWPAMRILASQ